jgi:hypothetical protein
MVAPPQHPLRQRDAAENPQYEHAAYDDPHHEQHDQ